ncbi:hypothetical protein D5W64_12160 [Salmonella enterica subsp. enterica serovar Saintpaul]|nr:hypothetical protein [Salmonella enterica subsp. enterica serovar Saintpaul]
MKQRYVVLEGLDLAGKSVMVKKLKEILGWETINEPYTGNEQATEVKRMNNANYLPKHYEMMMLIASRIDCFDEVVSKHRLTGLISDRSVVSSMVYQSTDKFHMNDVLELNRIALAKAKHDVFPDKIIFIDIPHGLFLERLAQGGRDIDEKDIWLKDPANWSDMRNRYIQALRIMNKHGVEIHIIDYETSPESVVRLIQK